MKRKLGIQRFRKLNKNPERPGWVLLNTFMKQHSINQVQLAEDLNVKQNRISDIINDRRRITADSAIRIAHYFGTKPEYWLELQAKWDIKKEYDANIEKELERIQNAKG